MIWGVVVQEDYWELIVGGRGTSPGVVSGKISCGGLSGGSYSGGIVIEPFIAH